MRAEEPFVGRVIQGYRVGQRLGEGAFGKVYGATDEQSRSRRALKFVDDRSSVAQRLSEPELLRQLDHPNIVHLHDYFLEREHLVLVMEWIEGGSLVERWRRDTSGDPRWTADHVRSLLKQMGGALAYAHSLGILHRDIKPANILYDPGRDRYVLVDFGVARLGERRLGERHTAGTAGFMAPEQILGRPEERSDLWALGVVAYFLRCGQLPFEDGAAEALRQAILHGQPRHVTERGTRVADEALDAIIMSLLARETNERIGSAAELLARLGEVDAPSFADSIRAPPPGATTRALEARERRLRGLLIALAVGWSLSILSPSEPLLYLGLWLVYRAHREEREGRALALGLAAYLALTARLTLRMVVEAPLIRGLPPRFWFWFSTVVPLTMTLCTWHLVPRFVGLRRHLMLRRTLLDRSGEPAVLLRALGEYVDANGADVHARVRLAEALSRQGQDGVADAAVECRLALERDPFNFEATLLLVHCYRQLGLVARACEACQAYLTCAPQATEFVELLRAMQGSPPAEGATS